MRRMKQTREMQEMGRLNGKIAVITGGTSDVSARTVEIFVEDGAEVVFCGRRENLGQALAEMVGAKAALIKTDVYVEAEVADLMARTMERQGRINILFINASGLTPGQWVDHPQRQCRGVSSR